MEDETRGRVFVAKNISHGGTVSGYFSPFGSISPVSNWFTHRNREWTRRIMTWWAWTQCF